MPVTVDLPVGTAHLVDESYAKLNLISWANNADGGTTVVVKTLMLKNEIFSCLELVGNCHV